MTVQNPAVTFKQQPGLALVLYQYAGTSRQRRQHDDPTFIVVHPQPTDDYATLVRGYIWIGPTDEEDPELDIYAVNQSAAVHGYGPLTYWSALEWCRQRDIWLMPGGTISEDARRLWNRLAESPTLRAETIDLAWQVHVDETLNAAYQATRRLPGYERALRNGKRFVADRARQTGLREAEVRGMILEAGASYFRRRYPDS